MTNKNNKDLENNLEEQVVDLSDMSDLSELMDDKKELDELDELMNDDKLLDNLFDEKDDLDNESLNNLDAIFNKSESKDKRESLDSDLSQDDTDDLDLLLSDVDDLDDILGNKEKDNNDLENNDFDDLDKLLDNENFNSVNRENNKKEPDETLDEINDLDTLLEQDDDKEVPDETLNEIDDLDALLEQDDDKEVPDETLDEIDDLDALLEQDDDKETPDETLNEIDDLDALLAQDDDKETPDETLNEIDDLDALLEQDDDKEVPDETLDEIDDLDALLEQDDDKEVPDETLDEIDDLDALLEQTDDKETPDETLNEIDDLDSLLEQTDDKETPDETLNEIDDLDSLLEQTDDKETPDETLNEIDDLDALLAESEDKEVPDETLDEIDVLDTLFDSNEEIKPNSSISEINDLDSLLENDKNELNDYLSDENKENTYNEKDLDFELNNLIGEKVENNKNNDSIKNSDIVDEEIKSGLENMEKQNKPKNPIAEIFNQTKDEEIENQEKIKSKIKPNLFNIVISILLLGSIGFSIYSIYKTKEISDKLEESSNIISQLKSDRATEKENNKVYFESLLKSQKEEILNVAFNKIETELKNTENKFSNNINSSLKEIENNKNDEYNNQNTMILQVLGITKNFIDDYNEKLTLVKDEMKKDIDISSSNIRKTLIDRIEKLEAIKDEGGHPYDDSYLKEQLELLKTNKDLSDKKLKDIVNRLTKQEQSASLQKNDIVELKNKIDNNENKTVLDLLNNSDELSKNNQEVSNAIEIIKKKDNKKQQSDKPELNIIGIIDGVAYVLPDGENDYNNHLKYTVGDFIEGYGRVLKITDNSILTEKGYVVKK